MLFMRVTQVVERLSDSDDRLELPAGPEGPGSFRDYEAPEDCQTEDEVLDWFHSTIPIGALDDFQFDVLSEEQIQDG